MAKSSSKSSKSNRPEAPGLVQLATLGRAHGIRGAVTLIIDDSVLDALEAGVEVRLEGVDAAGSYEIESLASSGKRILVRFAGVEDRGTAESLTGAAVMVGKEALPELETDEYYDFELVGATAVTRQGDALGKVVEILETGANDVYVVRAEGGGEILVPAIAAAVLEIDRENRRIVVEATALEYSGAE